MTHSPLLDSFDPFATHPFTNNSGLAPRPPQPSRYPVPIPSPTHQPHFAPTSSQPSSQSATPSSPPEKRTDSPLRSPRPRPSQSLSPPARPVFVPFRQETSSPDLVLKKRSSSNRSESGLGKGKP